MTKVGYNKDIDVLEGTHGGKCNGSIIRHLRFVRSGTYEEISKRCTGCNQEFKRELEYEG